MDLRSEITDRAWVYGDDRTKEEAITFANNIITLVRDALLSDKAISAAVDAREPFPHIMRADLKRHMTETLTAAMNAITQEEGGDKLPAENLGRVSYRSLRVDQW